MGDIKEIQRLWRKKLGSTAKSQREIKNLWDKRLREYREPY